MEYNKIKLKNYNLYILLIYFFWIISIISYFFIDDYIKAGSLDNGVKLGADSAFYLKQANLILIGEASILDYKSKFGYILFLIPFIYFDFPLVSVVCLQLLLTSLSALCLYKITAKFFCKLSGVICVALFLFYFPIQIRNFYILTEILFLDIVIILSFLLVNFKKNYIPLIIFLILTLISIRPNGILFLFSILISIFFYLLKYKKYLYLSIYLGFSFILIFPVFRLLNSYMVDLDLIHSLSTKGIIWGWSFDQNQICNNNEIPCLGIEFINNNYQNNIIDISKFILINFFEFSKIFFLKIFWLMARVRPYYSDLHNIYILVFNLIFYFGFIYGFIKRPKNNLSINIIILFIVFSMILVGLTFADWSGRFSLYFLPLIMIFASYGILILARKIKTIIFKY